MLVGNAQFYVPSIILGNQGNLTASWHKVSKVMLKEFVEQVDLQRGKLVRLPTPATEPQGDWLSAAADQTLSGGHMKAAGPISS